MSIKDVPNPEERMRMGMRILLEGARTRLLATRLEGCVEETEAKLGGLAGRLINSPLPEQERVPEWVVRHLALHEELEETVCDKIRASGANGVPKQIIKSLQRSRRAIEGVARQITNSPAIQAVLKPSPSSALLVPLNANPKATHPNIREWELNFGLLYSTYQRTEDEPTKELIRFLMLNYLVKAAFLNTTIETALSSTAFVKNYNNLLQVGALTLAGVYQRTLNATNPVLSLFQNYLPKLGCSEQDNTDFILLETADIESLYPISFVTTPDITQTDAIAEILVAQFEAHLDCFPGGFLEFPVLIDVTAQIGQSLITEGIAAKIGEYKHKQDDVRKLLEEIFNQAEEVIRGKYPDRRDIHEQCRDDLKMNTAVVCRAQINPRLAVLSLEPYLVQMRDPQIRRKFLFDKIDTFAGGTAIGLGAVNYRLAVAALRTDPLRLASLGRGQPGVYAVQGPVDVILYRTPTDLLRTNVVASLSLLAKGTAQGVLGLATARMLRVLLEKISLANWENKTGKLINQGTDANSYGPRCTAPLGGYPWTG